MKLPRNFGATLIIIKVITGMILPATRIINKVVTISMRGSGTRLKVTHKIGIARHY
ncbi:MAG: hypothetical protein OEX82_02025 [Nitrosomonas sp.]|nr:hypothetical protein [Nitrosomonas sp.]